MISIDMNDVESDVKIDSIGPYVITGTSSTYNIIVSTQLSTIYLDNVDIQLQNISKASILVEKYSKVRFILIGTNNLYSGCNYAGIQMNGECIVTLEGIDNNATLNITSGTSAAGIGAGFGEDFIGDLVIKSGNINITSTREGAGIGGGNGANGGGNFLGKLTIDGGNTKITSKIGGGAGIGGGDKGDLIGDIVINRGIVSSEKVEKGIGAGIGGGCDGNFSGRITINNGEVKAYGGSGSAGIGGGLRTERGGNLSGEVIIKGGIISAYGGLYISTSEGGAGIGGGYNGDFSGKIKLEGGNIKAVGRESAQDIGPGSNGNEDGEVYIKIKKLIVEPPYLKLNVGDSQKLKTTIVFEPSISANIDKYTQITYISKDINVVTVDQRGLVKCVGTGKTEIILTCVCDKTISAICEVDVSSMSMVIGEIDTLISIDKMGIKKEYVDNVICYGNNPIIIDTHIEEHIREYKTKVDIPNCRDGLDVLYKYKEARLYLSISYSIALFSSDNCLQNLKIYGLQNNELSSVLSFCIDIDESIDIDSFQIKINPSYTVDKSYSKKYYIYNVAGTVELLYRLT